MADDTQIFLRHQPRLKHLAYRMLGSWAEAEEVAQDAWLRWHGSDRDGIDNTEAWLVSTATRLSIDRLRAARTRRAHYEGIWLPEPFLSDDIRTPEQIVDRSEDVSLAFLSVLERLSPEARAAYILRDLLDEDYSDIAAVLGKTEAACRQLVTRARKRVREDHRHSPVDPATQARLLQEFSRAASTGDFSALKAALAADAQLIGDGGGKVPSFGKPLEGGTRIAQLYLATSLRYPGRVQYRLARLNGEWGLLRFVDGALESAQQLQIDGTQIVRIYAQRNPDKLAHLARTLESDPGLI
ncbi:MAG TPA: RNA polymerase sigma factor SigJ [Castellaniella sp.]|jgi:RNA polymerase sigma-70 factor (ECF subfamily)|nr:RNA polymerase sigma factor SigJ [Castellaniella sp.]